MPDPTFRSLARYDSVLCDVDGCLCDESGGPLDLDRLAAIAEHNDRAKRELDRPVVTVCTGRPIAFAECMCRLIHNDVLPCVAENGVWLYNPANNRWAMDPAITPEHRAAVRHLEDWLLDHYGNDGLTLQPGKAASVSPHHRDTDFLQRIQPEIARQCEERGWPFRVSATWNYINCDLKHISKGTGIARWVEATRADPDRLAGIGDTLGDRAIAESVAFFGAPANRDPRIDPVCDYISPHDQVAGVLDILDHLV